jgi:MFS family permease
LCGLTNSYEQLIVARILQGLGFGGELAVGALFVGEVASAKYRARMVGMAQSGWALGWAAAVTLSIFVLSNYPAEFGWRILFFLGVIPAVPLYIYRSKLEEPEVFRAPGNSPSWKAIFSGAELRCTLKGSLLAVGVHGGYWAIATWWPTMLLAERGLKLTNSGPYLAALIAGSFLGYAVGSYLGDKVGRRIALVFLALGGISVVLAFSQLRVSEQPFMFLSALLGFVATGMYGIIGSILMEQYPTELRGAGLGFCYNVGRGGAGFAPAIIGSWVALLGVGHAIALFVVCAYGLVLFAAALLPETRGRELMSLDNAAGDNQFSAGR